MRTKFRPFLLLLLLLSGCADIVEVDISDQRVTVISPENNAISSSFNQLFKWDELKGADKYQLQIVQPDFGNIQQYILDTSVSTTDFNYTLLPGSYQWRIRGVNSISTSSYSTRKITIDSTLDISGQSVVLISPPDNFSTSNLANNFSWQTMPNANNYIFQVLSGGSVIYTQSQTTTTTSYTFAADGTYQWRVFAQNDFSSSAFSTNNLSIDNAAPLAPVLLLPAANDSVSNPVAFSWSSDLSSTADSILIYADTNLVTLVDAQLVTSQTHTFNGTVGEDYFWRVRSKDAAGNWGPYAVRRKFIVDP